MDTVQVNSCFCVYMLICFHLSKSGHRMSLMLLLNVFVTMCPMCQVVSSETIFHTMISKDNTWQINVSGSEEIEHRVKLKLDSCPISSPPDKFICPVISYPNSSYYRYNDFQGATVKNVSPTEETREIILMGAKLKGLPPGNNSIHMVNVAYNELAELPDYVFWNNSYRNVKQVFLYQNKISSIGLNAFRGLKQMKLLDISDNNLTRLDPYTFKSNSKLHKLVLINNFIRFDRLQTFIISHSVETLVLSNNRLDEVYDVTFLGLPNLRRLIMSDNDLNSIEGQSFKTLSKLSYLSIANTNVYFLDESMFRTAPRMMNIENTPLADIFEPPLTIVRDQSVKRLLQINQLVVRNLTNV